MNATILFATDFPHGTPQGFTQGCKGAQCPAPAACRDVYPRFQGDYQFRKRVHAGESPAKIIADELAHAEAVRVAEKEAARREANERRSATQRRLHAAGQVAPRTPRKHQATAYQLAIRELHAKGMTDRQIGEELGKATHLIAVTRRNLGLATIRSVDVTRSTIRRLHAEGMVNKDIASQVQRGHGYIASVIRGMGLKPNQVRA